jgi:hypothetical protein
MVNGKLQQLFPDTGGDVDAAQDGLASPGHRGGIIEDKLSSPGDELVFIDESGGRDRIGELEQVLAAGDVPEARPIILVFAESQGETAARRKENVTDLGPG